MIIGQTKDIEEIKSILCHDDIFSVISEGVDIKPEEYEPSINDYYLAGYDDGTLFAIACFHVFNDGLKFHPNILKSYRLRCARDFVKHSLSVIKCPIYIEIPKNRKRLFNFAIKLGFDSVANNKDSANTVMRFRNGFY